MGQLGEVWAGAESVPEESDQYGRGRLEQHPDGLLELVCAESRRAAARLRTRCSARSWPAHFRRSCSLVFGASVTALTIVHHLEGPLLRQSPTSAARAPRSSVTHLPRPMQLPEPPDELLAFKPPSNWTIHSRLDHPRMFMAENRTSTCCERRAARPRLSIATLYLRPPAALYGHLDRQS